MTHFVNRRHVLKAALGMLLATGLRPAFAQSDRLRLAFIPQENPEKLLGDIDAISG